jgi:hypothetical protein
MVIVVRFEAIYHGGLEGKEGVVQFKHSLKQPWWVYVYVAYVNTEFYLLKDN